MHSGVKGLCGRLSNALHWSEYTQSELRIRLVPSLDPIFFQASALNMASTIGIEDHFRILELNVEEKEYIKYFDFIGGSETVPYLVSTTENNPQKLRLFPTYFIYKCFEEKDKWLQFDQVGDGAVFFYSQIRARFSWWSDPYTI